MTVNVVACILINSAQEILIAQRPKDKKFGEYWEFAGGKVEPHETRGSALVRELKEELNLDLTGELFTHFHREINLDVLVDFYLCYPKKTLTPQSMENQDFRWVKIEELKTINFIPSNQKVLDLLVNHLQK